ncbi:MAG: helix-turn-helix domain-containing protein [Oscillospiraceae bacterium]|nr:helix-turn-helix domain-containing protein [Oscillospiraceae bacterium]
MNKNKLRAVLEEHGENQSVLAEALGISRVTLSRKINEKEHTKGFSQPEISTIMKRYNLTMEQVNEIFFAD